MIVVEILNEYVFYNEDDAWKSCHLMIMAGKTLLFASGEGIKAANDLSSIEASFKTSLISLNKYSSS